MLPVTPYTQYLKYSRQRWLTADERDVKQNIKLLVLEQFVSQLPTETAEWVQYP